MEMDQNIFFDKDPSMPLLTSDSMMQESFKMDESDHVPSSIQFSTEVPDFKKTRRKKSPREINYRKQSFSKKWLDLPEFKEWLQETITPDRAHCIFCNMDISAGKSELQRHSKSKRHQRKTIEYKAVPNVYESNMDHLNDMVELETNNDDEIILRSAAITRIIDYRSDSLSHPNWEMRKAMLKTPTEPVDKRMDDLESEVAALLNKEAGLFFPTHIMANFVAILAHCWNSGSAVIFGDKSDIYLNNKEALVKFGRLHCRQLENNLNGCFSLDELEELLKSLEISIHHENLVCIESSHARLGGIVPPIEWITQVSHMCKNYFTLVHCDGTRLANASVYSDHPLCDLVKDCDSVTFGLDKSLGAPLGAVVAGNTVFIDRCKFLRNSIGGHIHQPGIFAAAGTLALNSLPNIDDEHQKALSISFAIKKERSKHVAVDSCSLQTNVIHLKCISDDLSATELQKRLMQVDHERDDVEILSEIVNENTVALWFHKDITPRDIRDTNEKLRRILRELAETFPQGKTKRRKTKS